MLNSLVSFLGTAVFLLYVLPMLFVINFYVTGLVMNNLNFIHDNAAAAFAMARVLYIFNSVCGYIGCRTRAGMRSTSTQRLGHHVLLMGLVGCILCHAGTHPQSAVR